MVAPSFRLCCLLLATLLASASARAQAPALQRLAQEDAEAVAEPEGYRTQVAAALAEYDAGHFEEARALFLRAHELFPNARTLRGIGMTDFELRNYGDAIAQLEAALHSTARPLEGALRSETEALLARARAFVARLAIYVTPEVASVSIDGMLVQPNDPRVVLLSVGEHQLEARAQGFLTERRTLRVDGGEQRSLEVVLVAESAAGLGSPPAQERSRAWYKRQWLWVSLGVVVAGAAIATGLALSRGQVETEAPYRGLSEEPPLVGPSR